MRWYDGSGRLTQIARWSKDPTLLTPEWWRQAAQQVEEALRSQGASESRVTAQLAELEDGLDGHDGPLPYWESVFVDRQGNAWLSEYPSPGQRPERWRVINCDGTFHGWVDLPGTSTILDVTDDRILAVQLGEPDVPAVAMIELIKP